MSLNAHAQQHLRTLRRTLNKAATRLNSDDLVYVNSGWEFGRAFRTPWIEDGEGAFPEEQPLYLFFPQPEEGKEPVWQGHPLIPEEALAALNFFWPGPLVLTVRRPGSTNRLHLLCPWRPLIAELLARSGPVFWTPLDEESQRYVRERRDLPDPEQSKKLLLWPDEENALMPTVLDASTWPWRLMQRGFVEADELRERLAVTFLLSEDRAFPRRELRTFAPQHRTVVLESDSREKLLQAIGSLRQTVPADVALRIYLDEELAHNNFPDDREVLVYGEMADPERVRRRLLAMLERQRRRGGKRLLLIGVVEMGRPAESLRADLEKVSDNWLQLSPEHEALAFADL